MAGFPVGPHLSRRRRLRGPKSGVEARLTSCSHPRAPVRLGLHQRPQKTYRHETDNSNFTSVHKSLSMRSERVFFLAVSLCASGQGTTVARATTNVQAARRARAQ